MARNPVQFQKGISLNEFLSLYATEDQCFDALYQWRWPNGFLCPHCGHDQCCQLSTTQAPTVQSLPPPDLHHRGHHLRLHQAAPHGVVPSHLPHDPGQERGLGDEAAPPSRHLLQRGVAHATQADAGDDGARPPVPPHRRVELDDACLGGERGAWRAGKDAIRGRRRDQRGGAPVAHEARRGRRTPHHRHRRLGAAPPWRRHSGWCPTGWPAFTGVTAAGCAHEKVVWAAGEPASSTPSFVG